jgi:uncharacterized protein (DUF433 family)
MKRGVVDDELLAFSERTAARVSGLHVRRLHDWARRGLVAPSVVRRLDDRRTVRLYAFTDLVDLLVVVEMIERGAHPIRIRRLIDYLRDRRHHAAPLRELEFALDAGMLYWREPRGPWHGGHAPNQVVIPDVLDLEQIRARARRAAEERPGTPGAIERRRGVLGGKLLFEGTRVPVESVQAFIERGIPDAQILEAYPLLEPLDIETARSLMRVA